jgi:undecaprenyl-diphosphatase
MALFRPLLSLLLALAFTVPARAGGGPLGIDHRVTLDESGIWSRSVQNGLVYSLVAGSAGLALWEGGDTRLGKTAWQSVDALLVNTVTVTALKMAFSRVRPIDSNNPDLWFQGHGNASFPSGEVSTTTAIVTPLMLEYGPDQPLVYALALLPAYDAVARVKSQGHWQTDVLAGMALGAGIGYLMHQRDTPLTLSVLPQGFHVGFNKRW